MSTRNFALDLDDLTYENAEMILKEIGLDMPTYIRIAIIKLVKEKSIPFGLSVSQKHSDAQPQSSHPTQIIPTMNTDMDEVMPTGIIPRETKGITRDMCNYLWMEFKRRNSSGNREFQKAAQIVSNETGMNRGSAFIYFVILDNLVHGKSNTRNLKFEDLEFFMDKIRVEYPESVLEAAISSLDSSISYWEEKISGFFAERVRRLVEKLRGFLKRSGRNI